jgi:Ca-activated chloride channel homolog
MMKKNKPVTRYMLSKVNVLWIVFFALLPFISLAQQEKQYIYGGNSQYKNKQYKLAEKQYSKALEKNKNSYKGAFNLGDAYYQQGKYQEAADQFQQITHQATSKDTLSKAYHNLGNALLKSKKYQESVDAYKNALKNNPNDEDTRYNLSYAQQMLRKQQEQQKQQQDKDKKENKDQKDKDKNKDDKNKDKKDQDKKDQDKKDKQDKDKADPKNEISKEDAKRILDALQNDEKNIHDNMKKGKEKGVKVKIEKDW